MKVWKNLCKFRILPHFCECVRVIWRAMFLLSILINVSLCNTDDTDYTYFTNNSISIKNNEPHLIWSQCLEDYVVSLGPSNRTSKDMTFMDDVSMHHGPPNYHSSAYQRPNTFITKRIGEAVELEPHMRPPVKIINPQFRPMTNQMIHQQYHPPQPQPQLQQQQHHQPTFLEQLFGIGGSGNGGGSSSGVNAPLNPPYQQGQPQRPAPIQHGSHQNFRPVSENDLYLLGAIEKLVYRVDYLESRVRRTEQLIYYLMAGNNQKEERDPCPKNFTRVSENCYHINGQQQVNWKSANLACKSLGGHLAEFEKTSENEGIIAYILNQPKYRARDFWIGGLNPGLIWIWSNSAKPVNPNMNLTSIVMSNTTDKPTNQTYLGQHNKTNENEAILNNVEEIEGQGRCLRLTFNSTKHSYGYYGQECTSRHHYICEYEDKTLDNKIKKLTRQLRLFD